jgi:cytochrome c553
MQNSFQQLGNRLFPVLFCLLVLGTAQAAPSIGVGSRLYAPCGTCHAPKAWGSNDGVIPNLAGQQRRYLEKQLGMFRSGARVDPAMQIVAAHPASGNGQDTDALAAYLSGLDWNPNPRMGSGEHLRVGQELFVHICAACHGADGRGDTSNHVPRIAGQHYPYLRRQLDVAAGLHRDLAPPEMTSALRGMRSTEMDALADYISRLGNAEALIDPNLDDRRGPQPPHLD